jgi:hypothetical protein
MQHLRQVAGEYVRKDSITTEMLKRALHKYDHGGVVKGCSASARKGNHEIIIIAAEPTPGYPDMEKCEGCVLYLACQTAGKTQAHTDDFRDNGGHARGASESKYACRQFTKRIRFLYHDTCCIEYDVDAQMITGHGTHGWSQSTNRAIDNYLEALEDCGYVTQDVRYEMLSYVRRDGKGTIDHEAPWYSTQPQR